MNECFLEINTDNLRHNYAWYKSKSDFVCPMIKANAYGVGEKQVFEILRSAGAKYFGVVRLSEALSVRSMDDNVEILLFNPLDESDIHKVIENKITPVISTFYSLKVLHNFLKTQRLPCCDIHIEIDTGMNRLGFKDYNLVELADFLKSQNKIKIAGVFSHLLEAADWPSKTGKSFKQLNHFKSTVSKFTAIFQDQPKLRSSKGVVFHVSSSKALNDNFLMSDEDNELLTYGLRPGLGLYGVSQLNKHLKPVLSLKAPIVDLKWVFKGETVSYDGVWQADITTLIGILPIGYADGFPSSLLGKAFVIIENKQAPVIGKICMDFIMVDLSHWANQILGNDLSSMSPSDLNDSLKHSEFRSLVSKVVTIFSSDLTAGNFSLESLAERAGLTTYEFLARLSARVQRRVIGS